VRRCRWRLERGCDEIVGVRLYLSRWLCLDVDANLARCVDEARRAVSGGAEMVVFPELFLTGYTRQLDLRRAREAFAGVSGGTPGVPFVFGSVSEEGRNRMTVWLGGAEVARYDKLHLFRPNREHELWERGDRCVAFRWRDLTVGLLNCNDLRFPEQARALRLEARCQLLLVPAWWPWRRDHVWRTLLRARAIENGVWVAGCAISGSVDPEEFAGAGNHVFDPSGEAVRTRDDRFYDLDTDSPPPLIVDPFDEAVPIERVEVVDTEQDVTRQR